MNDEIEDPGPGTISTRPAPAKATTTGPRPNADPDRVSAATNVSATRTGVVQPKPQALPKRSGPSSIIVSPRQKGNPVVNAIKSMPWEYGDIAADFVLGVTTCALFLSLKYHRLHPEYIYTRMRALQGRYLLRVILVLVDITNHEASIRELSKTSLINNVTLILCWSSAEGARYLELFKSYEYASPTAIKQHQSNAYADRMVDFITTPRSINKTDAVALVSQFGTLRTAVNARHEDVAGIAGWGEKKVQRWCAAVQEPFRVRRAARRGLGGREETRESMPLSRAGTLSRDVTRGEGESPAPVAITSSIGAGDADARPKQRVTEQVAVDDEAWDDDEEALALALTGPPVPPSNQLRKTESEVPKKRKAADDAVSDGVMAALSKLRKDGG